jgi:hypothetical protein
LYTQRNKVLRVHCARIMLPSSLFFLTSMYIHIYMYIYNGNSDRRFSLSLSHVNLDLHTQSFNKMNVYMYTVYNITFRSTSLDTFSSPICWTTREKWIIKKGEWSQYIKTNDLLDVSFLFSNYCIKMWSIQVASYLNF